MTQVATHRRKGGHKLTLCAFSNYTEGTTSQTHLNTSSYPSCIKLMAWNSINKTCSWFLDAACLPGTLFCPTLLYNMHEDFGMPTELLLNK